MTDAVTEADAAEAAAGRPSLGAVVRRWRWVHRLPLFVRRWVRQVWRVWRTSLRVRVLTTTLAGGVLAISALGGVVADRTRDGLFEARVQQVLLDSARSTAQVQATFDLSTVTTAAEVQQLLYDVTTEQSAASSQQRQVVILREADASLLGPSAVASDLSYVDVVSTQLRDAVAGGGQHWQSVTLPVGSSRGSGSGSVPGVVVGQSATVPVVGDYQVYFVYSLQPEQDRLDFLLRTLAVAAVVLVGLLGAMAYVVTRQTVRPVVAASQVAARFADGHLDERMAVRGADEMATLARTFNAMAANLSDQIARMEELSALQRRFVSDVSHELRTPLTTVRMAAEVIHDASGTFEPAVRRSAELMVDQLDRFESMLADLLEISRFDAGAATLDARNADVVVVVRDVVTSIEPLAERKGSRLVVWLPEEPVVADIDPRRVARIVRNLMVNAVEHADGTVVQLDMAADAQAVAVRVRDRGVGMDADQVEHVFDRFWRADPARARTTGGTGLGLAISAEDARLHGGRLEAWGRPGHGASFRLTLPLYAGTVPKSSPLPLVPAGHEPVRRARPHDAAAMPPLDPETGSLPVVPDEPDETAADR
ncbi:MAG: MtrAB system histidine kinase MtrB [Micrococcales bacterium]|nr:MtrAB system histidine kinase MtrB [Micrococcales bacterium]